MQRGSKRTGLRPEIVKAEFRHLGFTFDSVPGDEGLRGFAPSRRIGILEVVERPTRRVSLLVSADRVNRRTYYWSAACIGTLAACTGVNFSSWLRDEITRNRSDSPWSASYSAADYELVAQFYPVDVILLSIGQPDSCSRL